MALYYILLLHLLFGLTFELLIPREHPVPKLGNITTSDIGVRQTINPDTIYNVLFIAGADQIIFHLPRDEQIYDLGNFFCADVQAVAIGRCNDISVSQISVEDGQEPCTFVGIDGFITTIDQGNTLVAVAPPQNILSATCG